MNWKILKTNTKILNKYLLLLPIIAAVFTKNTAAASFEGSISYPRQYVNVSAAVLDTTITIYGYSSPNSKVELESPTVYSQAYTDDNGYFKFDRLTIPKIYNELCLHSTDSDNRQTVPVCLPPINGNQYHTNIGPVLLPPTISLNDHQVTASSDNSYSSGQAIPDSDIDIYFFQTNNKAPLIKPVQAFSIPKIRTHSDANGHFSFSLPTTYSSGYRLYASTIFQNNPSPKSNTLIFRLPSFFSTTTLVLISFFIATLILFIILVILFYSQPYAQQRNHSHT